MKGADALPFGDAYYASGNDWDWYHFGGLTHDPDSSTEAATYRQYSSLQGHWMSPDPYDGSYDSGNPQSFNRYSYAANNPVSLVDPSGEDENNGGYCSPDNEYCPDEDPVPYPSGGGGAPGIGVFDGSLDPRSEDSAQPTGTVFG